jgi:hypothetical protein
MHPFFAVPILIAMTLVALPDAPQAQPTLALPIDCTPGDTCFLQNYVDHDPGPGSRDFTCAGLSYDGHKGTDFGLPSLSAMERGVTVLASAAGTVRGVRNDMIDRAYTPEEDARIDGKDCGNGVVIDHGDGWETQYCHMRQGSVRVRKGQQVEAGEALGLVGLSGRTQFPHVHISVRRNGDVVDPFTPDATPGSCGARAGRTLWQDDLGYQPGGVMSAGFATAIPDYDSVKAGTAGVATLAPGSPAIVIWGFAFGGRQGDVLELRIEGPEGRVFDTRQLIGKDQAQFYRAAGKKLRAPLPAGDYTGTVLLIRDGATIGERTVGVVVQ